MEHGTEHYGNSTGAWRHGGGYMLRLFCARPIHLSRKGDHADSRKQPVELRVLGFGIRISDFTCQNSEFRLMVSDFKLQA